jgi:hypothetical protein
MNVGNGRDYCDSPDEIAKNPNGRRDLEQIAAGNKDAFRFMWVFWNFTHMYDDLVDNDKPVSVEDASKWFIHFLEEVSTNPFYLANKESLLPFMVQVCNRWCDGEEWERSGTPAQVRLATVVKCGDIDLFFHIAYLVGGWDHVRAMKHTRTYDPIDRKD